MLPSSSYHAGMRWPHQSCRLMHQSWMLRIHWKYVFAQFSGTKRMRPSSTASMAGAASGAMRTYHWSVSQGSSTAPQRSPRGTGSVCGSVFSSRPAAVEVGDHALARLEAIEPAIGRGHLVVQRRIGREHVDQRQRMALADLVVVEVVRRRDLHAAAAEGRVDVVVRDDRDQSIGERQPDASPDQVPIALVLRDARPRPCRRAWSRGGSWPPRRARCRLRAGSAGARGCPLRVRRATSRSDSAVCSTGSQLTRRWPR